MSDWTDAELEASVLAYRDMQRRNAESKAVVKKHVYRDLAAKFGRTHSAFEFRMQNISSVLHEQGLGWVKGLPPAGNVGVNVKPRIVKFLKSHSIYPSKEYGAMKGSAPVQEQTVGPVVKEAAYKEKLPALRYWLIEVAKRREAVTYGNVKTAFAIDRFSLAYALGILGRESMSQGEPILTAVVVAKDTRACGSGFIAEFNVDDALERQRLYEFWEARDIEKKDFPPTKTFEQRASRFVSVETRPDQAVFRRQVFEACGGKCVVTGCDIVQALDAAHKTGRKWREGHNKGDDGLILRKDIHALYDAGFIDISADGIVQVCDSAVESYGKFHGVRIKLKT